MRRTRADSDPTANNPLKPPPHPFSSVAATVIMDEAAKLGPSCAHNRGALNARSQTTSKG